MAVVALRHRVRSRKLRVARQRTSFALCAQESRGRRRTAAPIAARGTRSKLHADGSYVSRTRLTYRRCTDAGMSNKRKVAGTTRRRGSAGGSHQTMCDVVKYSTAVRPLSSMTRRRTCEVRPTLRSAGSSIACAGSSAANDRHVRRRAGTAHSIMASNPTSRRRQGRRSTQT